MYTEVWLKDHCTLLLDNITLTEIFPTEWEYWVYTVCFWRDEIRDRIFEMLMPYVSSASEILSTVTWGGVNLIYSHWPTLLLCGKVVQSRIVRSTFAWMFGIGKRAKTAQEGS